MTREGRRLVRAMDALRKQVDETRAVLQRYQRVSAKVVQRVEEGGPLATALKEVEGPIRRREVTESLDALEVARHRVRLAMFSLGAAQGTSISELGRQLGISRQLASRIATEAAELFG